MSLLGNRVRRIEDPTMLTTGGTYVDDIRLDGAAVAVYVRSPVAHAAIESIDTADALASPGVLAVVVGSDLDLGTVPNVVGGFPPAAARPLLAVGRVRFVGEPVAVVVAEHLHQATDAAEAVVVDYDPLTAVVTLDQAQTDEVLLFDEVGTNVVANLPAGPEPADFSGCDVVVRQRIVNQRVAAVPIEARAAAARWDGDRLLHYASSQGAGVVRDHIAQVYGIDADRVRVVTPDVGGGFGAKGFPHPEELLIPELARRAGRPVRWSETRTENLMAMLHGRGQEQNVEIGGSRDGRITAWRITVRQDAGAYPSIGAALPGLGFMMLTGTYDLDNVEFSSTSLVTNTTPMGAFRGAGRPEAAAAVERAVDLFAAEVGIDPAEVRRRNLLAPFSEPHRTPVGTVYDVGDYVGALDRVLDAAGYDELRTEQAERRQRGDRRVLGIGLACYVEITAMGGPAGSSEFGDVELRPDGSVVARTGSTPYGQGHDTTWAMIISDRLGVPIDRISVVHGDTDLIPSANVTGGSRSVQVAGSAMHDAADRLASGASAIAAQLLEAAEPDVTLDPSTGRFHVVGTPARSVGWSEVAAGAPEPLRGLSEFTQAAPSFPFGAHCAVVEVDLDTGAATLLRMVAVDDCGTIVNPLLADGQVHGGLAQGIAQALYEEVGHDPDGNLLTANLADYRAVSAAELPMFERVEMVTPTPNNPLGAKGIGESATIGSTPAVQNAVVDALSHLGVRHIDMPCTPERVWRALRAADRAGHADP